MSFNQLGLSTELLHAIADKGYRQATPIQQQAIPHILAGKDILAGAQTGTGKTAGFTLPLLQRLQVSRSNGRRVRVLVLTPTRELAAQVGESVREYGRHLPFRVTEVFGGVSINTQISKLRKGVDIVVATPGRLLDHLQQKTINLSDIEILVLDEADRMLDMGFIRDMRRIFKVLPRDRQNLLFSATLSKEIRRLAADPLLQRLQVSRSNGRRVRVLVLTPTRELAAQVGESVREYGRHLPFRVTEVFGGVSINTQISKLRKGVDIVVATPGRLLDTPCPQFRG